MVCYRREPLTTASRAQGRFLDCIAGILGHHGPPLRRVLDVRIVRARDPEVADALQQKWKDRG